MVTLWQNFKKKMSCEQKSSVAGDGVEEQAGTMGGRGGSAEWWHE